MRSNHIRPVAALGILVVLAVSPALAWPKTIAVSSGDNLADKIAAAEGGDVVLIGNGTYDGFMLTDRKFTEDKPLIIKAAPGATPIIKGAGFPTYGNRPPATQRATGATGATGATTRPDRPDRLGRSPEEIQAARDRERTLVPMRDSSYIVLDGLTFDGSNHAFYARSIDHVIFINLEVRNTGQEAIHVAGTSRYVDILHCRIHHTGQYRPQWAEGIYVGQGSGTFENEEYVWIEGNDIHHTANAEGIDIKSQSYHITIRGNKIHDIAPGTPDQANCGGISLEPPDLTFKPGVEEDIWIEDNEISDIRYGRWANGIMATGMGGNIKNNYIHDCEQSGIYFNGCCGSERGFTTIIFNNRIEYCPKDLRFEQGNAPYKTQDPGKNPNHPQAWYHPAAAVPATAPADK